MRILMGFLLAFALSIPCAAQTMLHGTWEGVMKLPPRSMDIALHVSRKNGVLSGTIGSPNPGAHRMPLDSLTLDRRTFQFTLAKPGIRYKGTVSGGTITGTFVQHGVSLPLTLRKEAGAIPSNSAGGSSGGLVGTWDGVLNPHPPKMHFVLHVNGNNGHLAATTDSPDQGVYGMWVDRITLNGHTLHFTQARPGVNYTGTVSGGKITGTFVQHGRSLPLTLSRAPADAFAARTPAGLIVGSSRKSAPDFTLRGSRGAMLSLSDYKGKVVLLDFWATWCGGCRTEIPWYEEFASQDKRSGLAVVGVSMDNGWKTVEPFMAQEKMNYPVVIGSDGLLAEYGIRALPATFLIDRDGRIADLHAGVVVNKVTFGRELIALLQENTVATTK